ncbi:MAG: acyltransferase family protein [Pseudonocardiaceae bacterium]
MVWSVIYTGLALITAPLRPTAALTQLGINLLTGTACYHLYFLVVTMQCYLLFPLFFRFLRASAGRRRHVVDAAESRPGVASSRDRV